MPPSFFIHCKALFITIETFIDSNTIKITYVILYVSPYRGYIGVIILLKKLKEKYYKSNFYKNWHIDKDIQHKLLKISAPSAIGFAVAASTLVGQNLGADKPEEAKEIGLLSNLIATVFMIIVGIIYYIFAPQLAGIFTEDTEVILQVTKVLRIITFFQPFLCITFVITSALQGTGDTKFPMYSTFIGIWGIRVIGTYILGIELELGLVGVWLSYAFDIFIRSILLMVRFLKGRWMKIKI